MTQPVVNPPQTLVAVDESSGSMPSSRCFGLTQEDASAFQEGGRTKGLEILRTFLFERGESYTKAMSSPVTAFTSYSRLSTYLAFGSLSIREVFQAADSRKQVIQQIPVENLGAKKKWLSAMRSFLGRLRWHYHFIQKLEDEPRMEFENLHPAYDSLREKTFNVDYFEAWKQGKTGYPMVDACMRAMLVSFASYHLWLHWREPALHLAHLFTDYEPDIHYSQTQMQSGTTGINSIRIYNPTKQELDHDPQGIFIRRWIPELADVSQAHIHTPWEYRATTKYPLPIVDEKVARKAAAKKLYTLRRDIRHQSIAKEIVSKHGSRKSGLPNTTRKKSTSTKNNTTLKQGKLL